MNLYSLLWFLLHNLFWPLFSGLHFQWSSFSQCSEQYCNIMKNTVTQKDEKRPVTGLDDAAILHIKIEITDKMYSFKNAQYLNTLNPNVPLTLSSPRVLK